MKRLITICLVALAIGTLTVVSFALPRISGSGNVIKETRNVGKFTGLNAASAFKIYVKQGSPQSVVIESDDNIIDIIETKVSNGVLKFTLNGSVNNPTAMKAYITVENLNSLDISGAASLIFETPVNTNGNMQVDISGAASIKDLNLTANDINIDASGASKITADINCKKLRLDASGASKINLNGNATDKIIKASGASSVKVENVKADKTSVDASGASNVTTGQDGMIKIDKSSAASVRTNK